MCSLLIPARVLCAASAAHQKLHSVDGFPVRDSDGLVLIGLSVCWGARDAYYMSLQQEQSKGNTHTHLHICTSSHPKSVSSVQSVFTPPSGLSASLAPPPLDDDLPVSERLAQVKTCLNRTSDVHRGGVVVTYDIIQVYKTLVQSCGISLEGNCEDPKVTHQQFTHISTRTCHENGQNLYCFDKNLSENVRNKFPSSTSTIGRLLAVGPWRRGKDSTQHGDRLLS